LLNQNKAFQLNNIPYICNRKIDCMETVLENKLPTSKPKWLRVKLPIGKKYTELRGLVDKYNLNTICTSGSCPNMGECWGEGTATFMILGNVCTRSCGFCGVKTGRPETVDWDEPGNIDRIVEANPEVVSHNIETVRRLTREVRIQAKYDRSMEVLRYLKEKGINRTKSGIMLGLGEEEEEVMQTLRDLRAANVDVVTIGQYLQPSKKHLPVKEYITPEQFEKYEKYGLELGFRHVESGALVRSSYKAQKHIL